MYACDHQMGSLPCPICSTMSHNIQLERGNLASLSFRLEKMVAQILERILAENPGRDFELPEGRRIQAEQIKRLQAESNAKDDAESPRAKAQSNAKQTIADLRAGHIPEPLVRDLKETCDRALSDAGIGRTINRR